ncbi:hypothetical protein EVAR_64068_1 [Eumeta japonica]|uniref:Uncharacterized protein n=1 Tax=Eumeta variegata TaxID=151549 RepID=A0A4C1ZC69_EUMVA|nr:hypothetical protein EVAR_64068_1 [Eumeta japonica]
MQRHGSRPKLTDAASDGPGEDQSGRGRGRRRRMRRGHVSTQKSNKTTPSYSSNAMRTKPEQKSSAFSEKRDAGVR